MGRKLKRFKKVILAAVLATALSLYGMSAVIADESDTNTRGGSDAAMVEVEIENETISTMAATASTLSVTNMTKNTKEDLVQSLLGEGVTVSNISLKSNSISAGKFTGGDGIIGFEGGIILSTGNIANVVGPYRTTESSKSTVNNTPGDNDLNSLMPGSKTFDATVLEFDFIPEHDIISFQYVFASNEYNQFVNQQYNDLFGFFINGKNAALIPGTSIPVSINTVNGGYPIGVKASNPQYYINNTPPGSKNLNTNLNGLTVVLSVQVDVNKGVTNHIKMAIADVFDTVWDSNVFIKAGSFTDKPINYPPVVIAEADHAPNANGWYHDDVTVTFTATDDDEWPVATVDPPVVISTEGADQLIEGTATDTAGLTGQGSILISLDKTAPITESSVVPIATNGWNNTDVEITLQAEDNLSGVEMTQYRINGGSWQEYADPITVSAEGNHTVEYYSTDLAGNVETVQSVSVKLDNTAPTTTASPSASGANGWYTTNATVSLTAADEGSGVATTQYRINGGSWQEYADPIIVSAEGNHTVEYYSTDLAGNVEAAQSVSVKLDNTAPTTTALPSTPGANGWYTTNATISLTAVDDGSGVAITQYRINGGSWQDYAGPIIVSAEGNHTIEYHSTDAAGNVEAAQSVSVKLDNTAPTTTALPSTPGANGWYTTNATISLTAVDDGSGVAITQYRINGGSWQDYTLPVTFSSDGIHLFEYYSADHAGNKEELNNVTLKVDKTAPTFTITANGSPLTNGAVFKSSQPVTLDLQAADNLSGVVQSSVTVDGKPYTPGTSLNWAGKLGAHTIDIVVTDQAGNVTQSQLEVNAATGLDVIRELIEQFSKSGDVVGPMQVQLSIGLKQAEDQYNKGHIDQAIKSMNDFLKSINNKGLQDRISANAKQILINEMNALIQFYSK